MRGVPPVELLPRGHCSYMDGFLWELHHLRTKLHQWVERNDRPGDHPVRFPQHVCRRVRSHKPPAFTLTKGFKFNCSFVFIFYKLSYVLFCYLGRLSEKELSVLSSPNFVTSWCFKIWRTSHQRRFVPDLRLNGLKSVIS